jgi:hypothetical protein
MITSHASGTAGVSAAVGKPCVALTKPVHFFVDDCKGIGSGALAPAQDSMSRAMWKTLSKLTAERSVDL